MAKIRNLYDETIKPNGKKEVIYPVTTTQAVFSQDKDGVIKLNNGKPEKLEDRLDALQGRIDTEAVAKVDMLDEKYANITNELYDMVASLQVGGIALSNQFGDREDIGITQKSLTKAIGRIWDEISTITGKEYMKFSLTVSPDVIYTESPVRVNVTADCSDSISNFDRIEIYKDNELVAESSDVDVFTTSVMLSETATIKAIGYILGKRLVKEEQVTVEIPFFMGGGQVYTDVINEECRKELVGSLQGDYDISVDNTGDYIFIIIPMSRKEEFRRANLDMNGFEIPMNVTELGELIICKTLNTYMAGTYNIDIDINN